MNTLQATQQQPTVKSMTKRITFLVAGSLAATAVQTTIFATGLIHTIAVQAFTLCR